MMKSKLAKAIIGMLMLIPAAGIPLYYGIALGTNPVTVILLIILGVSYTCALIALLSEE